MDPRDGMVVIRNSELLCGNLCKGTLGALPFLLLCVLSFVNVSCFFVSSLLLHPSQ